MAIIKKASIIIIFIVVCFKCIYASDVGTSGAQFLRLGVGARATSMGGAFTGVSDDATAVYWNPAGIIQLNKRSISLMHAMCYEGMSYEWLSFVKPTSIGNMGVGIQYFSYGNIDERDTNGFKLGNFSPTDIAIIVSYARKVSNIFIGVNAKYISTKIIKSANAYAFDMGVLKKLMQDRLSLGLVIQNVGTGMKFIDKNDPLPINIKLGFAYNIKENWKFAIDANKPNDNDINFGLGSEYCYKVNESIDVVGRAGYNTITKDTGGTNGTTMGLGIDFSNYCIDYAFIPFGNLGNIHRISFDFKF